MDQGKVSCSREVGGRTSVVGVIQARAEIERSLPELFYNNRFILQATTLITKLSYLS